MHGLDRLKDAERSQKEAEKTPKPPNDAPTV